MTRRSQDQGRRSVTYVTEEKLPFAVSTIRCIRRRLRVTSRLVSTAMVAYKGRSLLSAPPHRSRRALLTHRAPTLDRDEEPFLRPRMRDAWEWQVPVRDRLHSGPR